jgi:hypothetical protein
MARALRVALISGNRIIDDRVFAPGTRVTVGQAASDTFIVPGEARSITVFEGTKQQWSLCFAPGTEGQLSLDGADRPLSSVSAPLNKGRHVVALTDAARGRVRLGEVALLFQLVVPAPHVPPALLPKAMRGSLLAQVDRAFLTVLAISLSAHFLGAGWLALQPMPEDTDFAMEDLPVDRFASQRLPPPKPPPTAPPPTASAPERPTPKAAPAPAVVAHAAPSRAQLEAQVRHVGLLAVIGAQGPGGAVGDLLSERSAVGEVASALRDASAVRVAAVGDVAAAHGPTVGEAATIGELRAGPVHEVTLAEGKAVNVTGRVNIETIRVDTPEVNREQLVQWVRARTSAIQGCYERELKRNHALHGRLLLRFTITPRGRVADVGFDEDTLASPGVRECIGGLVSRWVLPFKPEEDVPVAFPWVFSPTT